MTFSSKKEWKALTQYASMAAVYMACPVQAQVVYVDIDPDILLYSGEIYTLDMDDDGQPDLQIRPGPALSYYESFGTFNLKALPIFDGIADGYSAGLMGSILTEPLYNQQFGMVDRLNEGDLISGDQPFFSFLNVDTYSWEALGFMGISPEIPGIENNWLPDGLPYFLGVRLMNWGEYYYGWVRVTVDSNYREVTIHDYAYQIVPAQSIQAGQVSPSVGLVNSTEDTWALISNPVSNLIRLQAPLGADDEVLLVFFDAGGRKILSQQLHAASEDVITIETSDLSSGLYLVSLIRPNLPPIQWTLVVN